MSKSVGLGDKKPAFKSIGKKFWEVVGGKVFREPDAVQRELLFTILAYNKSTKYGEEHNFATIKTVEEFQNMVPEVTYDKMATYIEDIKKGIKGVLTADEIEYFATSSGTTGSAKFIPGTKQRFEDTKYVQLLWFLKAIKQHPKLLVDLLLGKLLYLTGNSKNGTTEGGIPYGALSGILGEKLKNTFKNKFAVDDTIQNTNSFDERMDLLIAQAVPKDVRILMFAYPIEIELFLKYVSQKFGEDKHIRLHDVWENIALIGCFKNVLKAHNVERFVDTSKTIVMDTGIHASEGTISIDGMPAIQETFLEFKECNSDNKPLLVHQLQHGKTYEVIMTTPYGLYRYNVGDVIKVVGHKKNLPRIEFVGRNKTVSIVGELASYHQIEKSLDQAVENTPIPLIDWTVVGNDQEGMPHYELIIETEENNEEKLRKFLKEFDAQLRQNISSYDIMRGKGIFYRLDNPKLLVVSLGTYDTINKGRVVHEAQPKLKHILEGPAIKKFKDAIVIEKVICV